jgi:surfeit locus 1 family protein
LIRIGKYVFRPGLVPTLAALALLPLLLSLGNWQLNRAVEKRELQQLLAQRLQQPPVELRTGGVEASHMEFRKVRFEGEFISVRHVLLDNQTYQGRAGYLVFSPAYIGDGNEAVLVNRGWVPLGDDRRTLPQIGSPAGRVRLEGVLSKPPGKLLQLASTQPQETVWPYVVQQIDLPFLEDKLGIKLAPLVLQIDGNSRYAFEQHWRPYVDRPQKHTSYAIQWFTMAVVLVLVYFGLNIRRLPEEDL